MKYFIVPLGLGLVCTSLTGCILLNVEHKDKPAPQPQVEVVTVPSTTADSVTFAEIDAAAKLDFENSRVGALNTIAGRTNLSTPAQVCLVSHVFNRLDFENNKMAVLNTLIGNPAFSNPAKQTILTDLNKLNFDNNRAAVLASINQRGELRE
ncbi:MAG TPA: hypothetical protein VN281_21830 [Verrucomicrobiae bacterium]|nr:hypothetical protein [Verrucomicrobiae bacterium]